LALDVTTPAAPQLNFLIRENFFRFAEDKSPVLAA
jgi:hypothetical protein